MVFVGKTYVPLQNCTEAIFFFFSGTNWSGIWAWFRSWMFQPRSYPVFLNLSFFEECSNNWAVLLQDVLPSCPLLPDLLWIPALRCMLCVLTGAMAVALSQVSVLWGGAVLWQTPRLNVFPRELQAVCSAHLEAALTAWVFPSCINFGVLVANCSQMKKKN